MPAMQETPVRSPCQEDPLEKGMATHSSIFAWRIPWTEEPGRLQSTGSQRAGHEWATNTTTTKDQLFRWDPTSMGINTPSIKRDCGEWENVHSSDLYYLLKYFLVADMQESQAMLKFLRNMRSCENISSWAVSGVETQAFPSFWEGLLLELKVKENSLFNWGISLL